MKILAIDPGHERSAFLIYDTDTRNVGDFGKVSNDALMDLIEEDEPRYHELVIEKIACMGMAVGEEVFETVFWSGFFCKASAEHGQDWHRIKRHEVKMHLCNNMRAKDPNIRQALIDLYGGDSKAIGGKKCEQCKGKARIGRDKITCPSCNGSGWLYPPGPLHGISADVWSALAVAVTWSDKFAPVSAEGDGLCS